ncbi:hypothetical protein BEL04_20220 [Mucilaginibacter sp. PPCGB 2223]|uniref:DUF4286 family protein n=1 Tax=Mucilaginibacter sp. PPCGB 2223 TaxID=1886027 RepID=UPI000824A895|nr:DUF4286 family protein [Mucilaginibacter sp. PPCGB 2223]OCX51045.1 hypothetical protein BEL04_20220 [Mucilaginibacter sp. PPCGB 2223]
MIILNETIIIDEAIQADWLKWMGSIYIPGVMSTGYFSGHRVLTVLNSPNEGITYCLQFETDSIDKYHEYQQGIGVKIRAAHQKQFENSFVLFETIMQQVN